MKNNKNKRNSKNIFDSSTIRSVFMWMLIFMGMVSIMYHLSNMHVKQLSYSKFYAIVEHNLDNEVIIDAKKTDNLITGTFSQQGKDIVGGGAAYFKVYIPPEDKDLIPILRNNVKEFLIEPPKVWLSFFSAIFPMLLFILFLWYFAYRGNKQMGGNLFSFGKSKARAIDGTKGLKTSFFDVAGVDEAKEELKEIIEFLRDPKKFQKLGGRIPKGVLLIGPPGCGKTLLARAVAGEAEVPFFSISGSDFVEMFVGVGASRVRDLFEQAKKASKVSNKGVIVFIDEIDAVGRQRFSGIGGGHDEREQTLNQLLVEMDGFETDVGVIVVAATNRPDVLDPALLRPGRFDRHVVVDSPDILGRESILKVHTKKIKLGNEVKLSIIAKQTPGFSGADLENLCNEAALLAARREKESVSNDELQEAMERIIAGPQRKSRVISKKEKEITAYHEGGHALLHIYLKHADPLHKVSIIPRGITALGYTMPLPIQDKNIHSRSELLDKLCIFFGGVVAEELIFNEMTTGSSNDLEQATKIARRMVTEFGMSDKIGKIVLTKNQGPVFLGRDLAEHQEYSENTAKLMDQEIKKILQDSYDRAKEILEPKIGQLKSLAARLLEKEVMTAEEVKEVIGLNGKKSNENNSPEDK